MRRRGEVVVVGRESRGWTFLVVVGFGKVAVWFGWCDFGEEMWRCENEYGIDGDGFLEKRK